MFMALENAKADGNRSVIVFMKSISGDDSLMVLRSMKQSRIVTQTAA